MERRAHAPTTWMIAATLASGVLAGCSDASVVEPLVGTPAFSMHAANSAAADVIEDFGALPGAVIHGAWLVRNARGAQLRMHATVPAPNTATVWGVAFNAPQNCATTPCGFPDLFNPDAQASLGRAGGRVLGGSRVAITAHMRAGDTSEMLFGPGLVDAQTAEIHFILRVHGPALPKATDDQIHSLMGGCDVNECLDVGAVIFLPLVG